MYKLFFDSLTDKEQKRLENEILERIKDLLYIKGEQAIHGVVENLKKRKVILPKNDTFNFHYNVEMLFDDFMQIIGRIRRKKEEQVHKEKKA